MSRKGSNPSMNSMVRSVNPSMRSLESQKSLSVKPETMHHFKTLRHFPGLAQSLSAVGELQRRMSKEENMDEYLHGVNKKKAKPRPIQLKSTHHLSKLTGSSFDEINAMRNVKSTLIAQRARERDAAARERPKVLDKLETPLQRAEFKLGKCSMIYDKRRMNDDLAGFNDGPPLTFDEFDTQLRRCLNIQLSKEEFQALFDHMDLDGNKVIDSVEFIRYFFKVGVDFHNKIKERDEHNRQVEAEAEEQRRLAEIVKQQHREYGVISAYTQDDIDRAMMKLCEKSFHFDAGNFINAVFVKYFKCHLTPYEFKQQLEKSFDLKVTAAELGALVQRFTRVGDPTRVDGEGFLNEFLALHHYEVDRRHKLKEETHYMKHVLAENARKLDAQLFPKVLGR